MTKCPLWGSRTKKKFLLPHTTAWRCCAPDCGLEFAAPQLDDASLARAYSDLYYPEASDNRKVQFENTPDDILRQFFRALENQIGSLQGLRLLDYGCGRGALFPVSFYFPIRPVTTSLTA